MQIIPFNGGGGKGVSFSFLLQSFYTLAKAVVNKAVSSSTVHSRATAKDNKVAKSSVLVDKDSGPSPVTAVKAASPSRASADQGKLSPRN